MIEATLPTHVPVMTTPNPLTITEILDRLPHRYPFVMVDRVTDRVYGQWITGYKNVSANEGYFQGHFPDRPIMPGVLQLEALAQLAGLLVYDMPEGQGKLGVFTGVEKVRFRRMVQPGDRLDLKATLLKMRPPLCRFEVTASVDGETCVAGEISFSLVDA
jgi:3-hydroxyacyl-[acyl-carrier-protein] dehydratase